MPPPKCLPYSNISQIFINGEERKGFFAKVTGRKHVLMGVKKPTHDSCLPSMSPHFLHVLKDLEKWDHSQNNSRQFAVLQQW